MKGFQSARIAIVHANGSFFTAGTAFAAIVTNVNDVVAIKTVAPVWTTQGDQFIEDKQTCPDDLQKAVSGISKLINGGFSEKELEEFLTEVDWNYRPAAHNETHLAWLKRVLARLEKQTGIKAVKANPASAPVPPSLSDISGNTSDDRLRRASDQRKFQFHISQRLRSPSVVLLVLAFFWEMGYQSTKRMYAGTGVEVSRFGGFLSMLRQLFGVAPHRPAADKSQTEKVRQSASRSKSPQLGTDAAKPSSRRSTVMLVAHHNPSGPGEEEFVFEIKLYKKDRWFDTGIPIAVGNYIWAYPPNEEPNAIISAKIAGSIRDFIVKNNERPYPSLNLVIMSHEVEHEHVVLRNDEIEYLSLKLKENSEEHVRLFVRLSFINVNGTSEETKQRQIALIERSSKRAGFSKAR